jgi:predicted SnoaL-like aldol condensation-catalyzing enzyme
MDEPGAQWYAAISANPLLAQEALPEKRLAEARFFLQHLEHENNLNTRPTARRNRWRESPRRFEMSEFTPQRNKAFVLEAFETLFNRKDFVAAEKFWSPKYIQHSAHIPPGRDGLFGLVKSLPSELKYENSLIMAEGDMLMLHGRFSGIGLPINWIVVDIVRIENGLLAEHWDVIQDEATKEQSKSKAPMFGDAFPA